MEFKELFTPLYACYGIGQTKVQFFRTLISFATKIPAEKAKEGRNQYEQDYEQQKTDDVAATIRDDAIYKEIKSLSRKYARRLLNNYNAESFREFLQDLDGDVVVRLVEGLQPVLPKISKRNYVSVVQEAFEQCVNEAAMRPRKSAKAQSVQDFSALAKEVQVDGQTEEYLLIEAQGLCMMPNCDHQLTAAVADTVVKKFKVCQINPQNKAGILNLAVLCLDCAAQYIRAANTQLMHNLQDSKNCLIKEQDIHEQLSQEKLDEGLIDVIQGLENWNGDISGVECTLEPVTVEEKIPKSILLTEVTTKVTNYFSKVRELMQEVADNGGVNYQLLQSRFNVLYLKLEERGLSQMAIFESICQKVGHVTRKEPIYCEIIVSYFIQTCDIFRRMN